MYRISHAHAHMHTRTHAHTHTRTHAHMHTRTHAQKQTHTRTHASARACARTHTSTQAHASTHGTHAYTLAHAQGMRTFPETMIAVIVIAIAALLLMAIVGFW